MKAGSLSGIFFLTLFFNKVWRESEREALGVVFKPHLTPRTMVPPLSGLRTRRMEAYEEEIDVKEEDGGTRRRRHTRRMEVTYKDGDE